ncbi:NAD(P)/FAD-dependent oxidoreductase [Jiella pacifica]|nr:FAD-binding oxidoreductase [Jiella pacifica]
MIMPRLSAEFLTGDAVDTPYWWEAAKPSPASLDEFPARAEVAIVGAGFTGLNAAIVLARAGKQVHVFEAEAPGFGASSRNGGLLGPGWAFFDGAVKQYGLDVARRVLEESAEALEHVKQTVTRENIECDLKVVGYFKGAISPRAYDKLGHMIDRISKAAACDAYMVPRVEQHAEIGTDLYHGGVVMPGYAGLHPAKYVKGLADAATRLGVKIHSNARVSDLSSTINGFRFKVNGRDMTASQVLLATNGFSGTVSPYLKRRIMPIGSGIIATEPLPPEVMDRLMPKRRMLAGSQRVVTYYRPSPDGTRIVFGGRVLDMSGKEKINVANARYLRSLLLQVFPELESTKISHYWHGLLGFTFDHFPHVKNIDGVFFAGAYNGTGVARASWLGKKVAHQMLGLPEGKTVYSDLKFSGRPYFNGTSWFLPIAVRYYGLLDKWEKR